MAKGTAQLNLSPIETSKMDIIIPPLKLLKEFHAITYPLLRKIIFNKIVMKKVETLRNTLLPKLMTGEIKVQL
jgi:type I restriction enzyme S subunit